MPSAKSTMAHVARLAGVSAMTVSRALRNDTSVSAETRTRVLTVINEIGYVPDFTANAFASGRSGFISALVPALNSSQFADTVRGITEGLVGSNLQLLLGYTDYSTEREEELVATMLGRRPEGIILTGGRHTDRMRRLVERRRIPVIETWDLPEKPLDQVVGFSNNAAMRAMVHHLVERGYRRIGFIGGATNRDTRGADRRNGYIRVIEELGLPQGRIVILGNPPMTMEQGGEAFGQMIQQWPDIDAVVCVSDMPAFGVLMECHRRGVRVPQDVAIAGFGDMEISRCAWPKISTVAVNSYQIGRQAGDLMVRTLAARARGECPPPATVLMEYQVIARETT